MIEFIILGIVPGTSVQITFSQVTTLAWVLFVIYMLRSGNRKTTRNE